MRIVKPERYKVLHKELYKNILYLRIAHVQKKVIIEYNALLETNVIVAFSKLKEKCNYMALEVTYSTCQALIRSTSNC